MAVCSGIKYVADFNTITINHESGDVKGDTYDNGYNRQDIYDTDQANGWGVFSKYGNKTYISNASIQSGRNNINTYFYDNEGGSLVFIGSFDGRYLFYNEGYMKLKYITIRTEILGIRLSTQYSQECICDSIILNGFEYLEIAGSVFKNYEFQNCKYNNFFDNSDLENGKHIGGKNYGNRAYSITGNPENLSNIQLVNYTIGLYLPLFVFSGTSTIESLNIIDCTYDIYYNLKDKIGTVNCVNSRFDITNENIIGTFEGAIATLNLQNRFQIYIENAANASATLKDKDGNTIISGTLDANGEWLLTDPVTWVQRYLETADGELVENQLNYFEPFTLEVKKAGLQDLIIPNIYCSIYDSEKGKRIGSLEDTVVEGQMVGKNYRTGIIEGEIQHEIIESEITHTIIEGEVECV